ncbi:MAG: patatin-like phospholipase family protein [Coriobacteriales bacterium]|jgi:predicted patatin/cPLA2 family phospholipase
MSEVVDDIYLPPEIYIPSDTPGYRPAFEGHEARDLNLVVEGGALRGIFAAGALDFLMDMGIWAKNLIGVSAGSLCGFNYVSGQRGRTAYINTRFCNEWRYLSLKSFFVTGNAYGVEFAFFEVPKRYSPQDNRAFMNSPCRLIAPCTNLETGKADYFPVINPDVDWPVLRASSAMPFVSHAVDLDGAPHLDGGIADPIPLDHSLEIGADKHIVLLTQDRGYVKEENKKFSIGRLIYRDYPDFCQTMECRHEVYNDQRKRVAEMHEKGEIFAIYPPTRPDVARMETSRVKVFSLYLEGYLEAQRQWPALKAYLES